MNSREIRNETAMGLTPLIHVGKPGVPEKGTAAPRKRGAMQNRVLAELRHGLMVGAFVPGQTITLRRLAEMLGTSPMPVREAINQLTAANALEILPNGSVAVPRMSAERFRELTRVRQTLEGLAAEMACANTTPDLIRQLTAVNSKLREAVKTRHILRSLTTNQEFHFTLYGAAQSVILSPLIESLWLQAGPIMYLSLTQSDTPWDAACHDEVVAALKTGNPANCRRAIQHDIGDMAKSLLRSSIFRGTNGGLSGLTPVR
jgi:DNA-binding GntR family transcriptional regulator